MVTTRRGRNLNHLLFSGEEEIGEAWKLRKRAGFGVRLHGIYWLGPKPNTRYGTTVKRVPRLKDAVVFAEEVLNNLALQGGVHHVN